MSERPEYNPSDEEKGISRRDFLKKTLFAGAGAAAGFFGRDAFEKSKEKVTPEKLFSEEKELIRIWSEETEKIPEDIRQLDGTREQAWGKYEEIRTRLYAKLDASKSISGESSEMQSAADKLEKVAYENYLKYEEKNHE